MLSTISSKREIPLALQAYEKSRKRRAETVQQSGTDNRHILHLPDGPEQRARDEQFRAAMTSGANPDKWADRKTQEFLWGWDAEEAAREAWNGELSRLLFLTLTLRSLNGQSCVKQMVLTRARAEIQRGELRVNASL